MGRPEATQVDTAELCYLGCGQIAQFSFRNGKLCCAMHFNSCPAKRKRFSEEVDHKAYSARSLQTRIARGITKSSQVKGAATRKANGHYQKLSTRMQHLWVTQPWNANPKWREYKETGIIIQSKNEYDYLESLEKKHGLDWVKEKVARGPYFWYIDPITGRKRLYLSDFLVNRTLVVEVKGSYTWDSLGRDPDLRARNEAKLQAATDAGYDVTLILDGREIDYGYSEEAGRVLVG